MKKNYSVVGSEESIAEFELLLALINRCTTNGSLRTISVSVDGRGTADLMILSPDKKSFLDVDIESIRLKEEGKFRRFYGDNEAAIKETTDTTLQELEKDIGKFGDGHDISINIGE